jgi:hypothetical protein
VSCSYIVALLASILSIASPVQAKDCIEAHHLPTEQKDRWPLVLNEEMSDTVNFYFNVDRSGQAYKDHWFFPPKEIFFQLHIQTTFFDKTRTQNNQYGLLLNNDKQMGFTSAPWANKFIYTIYWGESEDKAIYKKSWYLNAFDACSRFAVKEGLGHLNFQSGPPKAILTAYF